MIFFPFKRCEHDFKEVEHRTEYIDGIKYNEILLFCPKCNKRKWTDADKWRQKKKMEKIKREYKSL